LISLYQYCISDILQVGDVDTVIVQNNAICATTGIRFSSATVPVTANIQDNKVGLLFTYIMEHLL